MYKNLFLFFLIALTISSKSQNIEEKIDSLFQELSQIPESDLQKQTSLHLEICKFSYQTKPELCLEHGLVALKVSKLIDDRVSQSRALVRIGMAYDRLGETQYALSNFFEGLFISRELGDEKVIGDILNEIGGLYLSHNVFDKAEIYYKESLQIRERLKDKEAIMQSNVGLAGIYMNNEQYDLAMEAIEKAIVFAAKLEDKSLMYFMIDNKAEIYSGMGEIDKAIPLYEEAVFGLNKIGNVYGEAAVLKDYSASLLKAERYNDCINNAKKGLSVTKKMLFKIDFNLMLANSYKAIGDVQNSFAYQSTYIHLSDSMRKVEEEADISRLEIVYKVKQKDEAILLKDKALRELEQKQHVNRLIWGLIGLSILLLSAIAYIINSRLKNRIRTMDMEMEDKDRIIAEIALKVINKEDVIESVSDEKYRSGAIINKEKLEEYILTNHNQFVTVLSDQYPTLSSKEKRICSLIKL